jgi:hypothetical protein
LRTRTTPASRGHAVKLALTAPAAATPRCLLWCAKVSLVLPQPRREREIPLRRGDTIPFPLCEGGIPGGGPMARQHGTRQPAPGRRDGHDHRRGAWAWSDKASGTGHRDGHDHSSLSSRTASADRSQEAPAPGCLDGTIRSPASYPTRAIECPSSEFWCRPAGARKSRGPLLVSGLGPARPSSNVPPDSGLGCHGPTIPGTPYLIFQS